MKPHAHHSLRWHLQLLLGFFLALIIFPPIGVVALGVYDETVRPTPDFLRDVAQYDHEEMTRRLAERYPVGMAESELTVDLERLGFRVDDQEEKAQFFRPSIVCSEDWHVSWTTGSDGLITDVVGQVMGACL